MVSTRHSETNAWILLPEEDPDPRLQVKATFIQWLQMPQREGYALVQLTPALGPENWGLSRLIEKDIKLPLEKAILVPRHAGYSLVEGGPYPLSAHIVNVPEQLPENGLLREGSLRSLAWAMVYPFMSDDFQHDQQLGD